MWSRINVLTPLGEKLSGKLWGNIKSKNKVLSVHGWMDNSGSFDRIAPIITSNHTDVCLFSLDLPGHGKSYHRKGSFYHITDYVADVKFAADKLGWEKFEIMSHSMGAVISSIFAAVYPQRVNKMMLIDGIGGMVEPVEKGKKLLLDAINTVEMISNKKPKEYSWEEAIEKITERGISKEGAECLLREGTEQIKIKTNQGDEQIRYSFIHHNLLRVNSPSRYTLDHMEHLMDEVSCPVLLVVPNQGWKFPENVVERCLQSMRKKNKHPVDVVNVTGGHHIHLDEPHKVYDLAKTFLFSSK